MSTGKLPSQPYREGLPSTGVAPSHPAIRLETKRDHLKPLHAFSLIDLLVLITLVTALALLQLAAASHPKTLSATALCRNNLRQLTHAWTLYAHDNQGRLPGNLDGGDAQTGSNTNRGWCIGWLDFGSRSDNTNLLLLQNGQLGKYIEDVRIFKCPADTSVAFIGGKAYPRVRSVAMNSYVGERSGPYTSGYRQFKKLSEFVAPIPSQALVFADEREDSINDQTLMIDMSSFDPARPDLDRIIDYPSDYHDRGANLSFVDGHVETWHWRDTRTTPPHRRGSLIPLAISSPNNPDVERLQAAASRKLYDATR